MLQGVEVPRPLEDTALTSVKADILSQLLNKEGSPSCLAIPSPSFISFTASHRVWA